MRKEYIFIGFLLLLAVALFGFGSRAGVALQTALRGTPSTPGGTSLTASVLGALGSSATVSGGRAVPVYSQYPFNVKNELSIAAGSAEGIAQGDVALAGEYVVGIVGKVFEHSAVVETLFDRRFQTPVRIGPNGADALLKGGSDPALTLISSAAEVSEGDQVTAAAKGLPYGIVLGTLRNLHDAGDKVFREASLAVPYDPGSLQELIIVPSPAS